MYLSAKNFIENLTGFTIYRKNTPWGVNLHNDLRRLKPDWNPKIVFDVGANVGQTTTRFVKTWPNAKIFSFEPVNKTFEKLKATTSDFSNVEVFPLALGSKTEQKSIKIFSNSLLSTLDNNVRIGYNHSIEIINVSTIDEFCVSQSIEKIDFLKIDTEGHDLEVLKGSNFLLENGKIDFILAEISSKTLPGKISLTEVDAFLEQYGMLYIGVYEQDFFYSERLAYGNCLFGRQALLF